MPNSPQFADEVRRALLVRADQLEESAQQLRGPIGRSKKSLRRALDLVAQCPETARLVADHEWQRNNSPESRVQLLLPILRHLVYVANLLEQHLAHGTRRELSEPLVEEIEWELECLELTHYSAVIAHGAANNFETSIGDIAKALYDPLASPVTTTPPPHFYALFRIPRLEGTNVPWRPILLGHEVAHVAVNERGSLDDFDLAAKFDHGAAKTALGGKASLKDRMALYGVAKSWTKELLCDAHAVNRFGPAAVASLAEYFFAIGAMDQQSESHPPGNLRIRLLLNHLGTPNSARIASVLQPWQDKIPPTPTFAVTWMQFLADLFVTHSDDLWEVSNGFPSPRYDWSGRAKVAESLADEVTTGRPGTELVRLDDLSVVASTRADYVNAAWICRVETASTPIGPLCAKGMASTGLLQRWVKNAGPLPLDLMEPREPPPDEGDTAQIPTAGTLAEDELLTRLKSGGGDRLIVRPLLQRPKGAGLDLRLGNQFIVFRRSGTASFDPLAEREDPRSIQDYVELGWTETFVLHPNELVLGATLEYMVLPSDLTAQVVTRSSYGRLGLLTATAVQVHPHFHGCLTLELANLSNLPLVLTPGERIAQLVLSRTVPVAPAPDEKYAYPTGPQFSKVRNDPEAMVLRGLRSDT
jgi:deoxycytidine triphosphate deaminase